MRTGFPDPAAAPQIHASNTKRIGTPFPLSLDKYSILIDIRELRTMSDPTYHAQPIARGVAIHLADFPAMRREIAAAA